MRWIIIALVCLAMCGCSEDKCTCPDENPTLTAMSNILDWEQSISSYLTYSTVEVNFRIINTGQYQIDFWKAHLLMMAGTTSLTEQWQGFLIEAGDTIDTRASFFLDGFTKQIDNVGIAQLELFNF